MAGLAVNLVFVVGEADLEVRVTAAPGASVGHLVEALAGGPVAPGTGVAVGGRFAGPATALDAMGLRHGDVITLATSASRPATGTDRGAAEGAAVEGAEVELVVVGGLEAGRRFPLAAGEHVVGRAGTVLLHQETVSARHALVEVSGAGACAIEDLGSRNGTRIDGEFVVRRRPVAPGALLQLGAVQARLQRRPVSQDAAAVGVDSGSCTATFNRPPRLLSAPPPEPVPVPHPPREPAPGARCGWAAILASVVLGLATAALFSPVMAAFALFSPVMVLAHWLEDRHRVRRERADGRRQLAEEVGALRAGLARAASMEAERRWVLLPGPAEVLRRATGPSVRLWERRAGHDDAFRLSLGVADVPWTPPLAGVGDTALLPEAAACVVSAAVLPRTPVEVDLSPGRTLGVVGPRPPVIALLRGLVCQAAVHHGPADLALAVLTDDHRAAEWDWAKWLPHTSGIRAAGTPRVEQVVAELAAKAMAPTRATLLVVDGGGLTEGRNAPVRDLLDSATVSGIVVADCIERLPSVCTSVVVLEGPDGLARFVQPATGSAIDDVLVAGVPDEDARRCARALAGLEDPEVDDEGAYLPPVVALLELLGRPRLSGREVLARWRVEAHRAQPTLAVPVGVTRDGPLVIDLVGDGPHALVAGTTGSGKSELVRSLVAGLAATYGPERLTFVLIDYKGGAAFGPLAGLPHVVGLVTDLDGHLGERALRCLEAELRYRERCLRRAGVADLPGYLQAGPAAGPTLPRLVVIVDEFATLAAELPGFVDSLVGIAQRGRSLGVHLLLATQRPAGVVNDNIRANTNLRIALRVQDGSDSSDVIGTPQAADLDRRRPGRGYVRLGHGEVVAFQAALATTVTAGAGQPVQVRAFGFDPGAGDGPCLPAGPVNGAVRGAGGEPPTDLARLVEAVREAARLAPVDPPRRPWPEPLPGRVDLATLPTGALGLADEPDRQRQVPFAWSPVTGNLLLYGVAGSGTTTALSSLALSLARATGPDALHLYVIDAGAGALAPLVALPHVGAVVGAGERERQQRLLRTLRAELERRRADGAAAWPTVVLLIDNLGGFCASLDDVAGLALRDELLRLAADGPALRMVMAASADRPGAVPVALSSLVPEKLLFRLADPYDYAAFGIAAADVPAMGPGRAIDAVSGRAVQVAVYPEAAEGEGISEPLAKPLAAVVQGWGSSTTGPRPAAIAVLPERVGVDRVLPAAETAGAEWFLPLGLGDTALAPAGFRLGEADHALVVGPARAGRSTTLCLVAALVARHRPDVIVTAVALRRSPLRDSPGVTELVTRAEDVGEALARAGERGAPQLVLIDDAECVDDPDGAIAALLGRRRPDLHLVAAGRADALRTMYGHWSAEVRRSRQGLALRPQVDLDGDLWDTLLPRHGPSQFGTGRGYLVTDGRSELVQVARP